MTKCSLILSIKNCFKNPQLEIKLQIKKKLLINTVDLKHEVLSAFTEHNTSREQYNPKIKISLAKRGSFLPVSCDSFFFFQYVLEVVLFCAVIIFILTVVHFYNATFNMECCQLFSRMVISFFLLFLLHVLDCWIATIIVFK